MPHHYGQRLRNLNHLYFYTQPHTYPSVNRPLSEASLSLVMRSQKLDRIGRYTQFCTVLGFRMEVAITADFD